MAVAPIPLGRFEDEHKFNMRSCARCGAPFEVWGRAYLCENCFGVTYKKNNLTFRDRQIIELVAEAKSNKEIAWRLRLAEGTVKEYLYHIFRKTGSSNRTELALRASLFLAPRAEQHADPPNDALP